MVVSKDPLPLTSSDNYYLIDLSACTAVIFLLINFFTAAPKKIEAKIFYRKVADFLARFFNNFFNTRVLIYTYKKPFTRVRLLVFFKRGIQTQFFFIEKS